MAAKRNKRAAPNKRVLVNQEVSRSKGQERSRSRRYTREIVAFSSLAAAVGLFFALATCVPPPGSGNLVGRFGNVVALLLFKGVGLCAWLFPAALFYVSLGLFVPSTAPHRTRQIAGLVAVAFFGMLLADLLFPDDLFFFLPGGTLGHAIVGRLEGFRWFGTLLLTLAGLAGALIVATDSAFTRLCIWLAGHSKRHGLSFGKWAALRSRDGWRAFRERREQMKREAAEEEEELARILAEAQQSEAEGEEEAGPAVKLPISAKSEPREQADEGRPMNEEEALRIGREAAACRLARRYAQRGPSVLDPIWAMSSPVPEQEEPAPPREAEKPSAKLAQDKGAQKERGAPLALVTPPARPERQERPEPLAKLSPVVPLIVEPKAPPKPSNTQRDPFAFEGPSAFSLPPITLLEEIEQRRAVLDKAIFLSTAERLREKLASFGIDGQVKEIRPGPVVTMYEFEPAPGVKISKIASLADDLAMAMEALKVRIVAPIPGKGVVGIEVPNRNRETVFLREIVEQDAFIESSSKLAMAIGKDIEGQPYVADLAKMPHVLIAGTTGSGKSVSVNAMIMSFLFKATPEEVRMIMVDPKVTELSIYEGIPHLLLPVVTDARKAAMALRWAVEEMERRYQLLADAGVRNIGGYNKWVEKQLEEREKSAGAKEGRRRAKVQSNAQAAALAPHAKDEAEAGLFSSPSSPGLQLKLPGVARSQIPAEELAGETDELELSDSELEALGAPSAAGVGKPPHELKRLPYIVIVIDEVADLMMVASREVETYVARLAQMARAAGVHLMVATQRPSTDVITGVIKANFPSRISFQLRSKPDSMTILGMVGAEALLGMGDMLVLPPTSSNLERVHGAFVSDAEIQRVVSHLRAQGKPVYDESILRPRDDEEGGEGGGPEGEVDAMYDQCLAVVSELRQISVSMLQRKLRLGYNRAARIIERMEREGVVGPANGAKPRDVLIRPIDEEHREPNF